MSITITRKIRSQIDDKPHNNISLNIGGGSTSGGTTIVNNILKDAAIEESVIQLEFGIVFDFTFLRYFEYVCMDDLYIMEQESELGDGVITYWFVDAWVTYTMGNLLSQFDKIRVTPTQLGLIILKGGIKL